MSDHTRRDRYIPQAGKLIRDIETTHPGRPVRDGSLVASAQRVTAGTLNPRTQVGHGRSPSPAADTGWQADAWDMYDLVGELQFLVNNLANRTAQARLYVGRVGDDTTDDPQRVPDQRIAGVLTALADSPKQLRQHVARLSAGLRVAGEGWLAGVPSAMMPRSLMTATSLDPRDLDRPVKSSGGIDGGTDLGDIEWRALSTDEVVFPEEGRVTLRLGGGEGETPTFSVDDVLLIRVWRPHPRRHHEPDSPVRSLLPALRTLVGLDMRTAAQIDSRLAGAGMLVVPASAQQSLRSAAALAQGIGIDEVPEDQFTQALMLAMLEPIRDRSNASALVPIVATVPDEATDRFSYMDFSKPLDDGAPGMVDQAIRRIALGMDCPPELLLGASCVDDQTEALTRRGWVLGSELQAGDEVLTLNHETGISEWKPVQAMNRYRVEDHDMLRLEGKGHSSLTTMNHRWPVIDANTGERKFVLSEELNTSHRIPTAAPTDPQQAVYSDAFVELVGWFWTEGSYTEGTPDRSTEAYTDSLGRHYPNGHPGRSGKWGQACIAQSSSKNPERVARIRAALETEFGQSWGYESMQTGEWGSDIVRFNLSKHVYEVLAEAGGKVPTFEFVQSLTQAQLELFIDVSCQGDGWHYRQGRLDIWQREREALEAYALALTLSGRMVTWTEYAGGYVVSDWRGKSTVRPIKANMHSVETYTGEVWCPTVENGTWLARREGSVWFTGNSMNHWGAWLTGIDTVMQHIAPNVELICDALTTQYLWPVLTSAFGMSQEEARRHVVWYEVEHLIVRPNRTGEAVDLFDRGIISAAAVRREAGYEEQDAPDTPPPAAAGVVRGVVGEPGAPPTTVGEPALAVGGGAYGMNGDGTR